MLDFLLDPKDEILFTDKNISYKDTINEALKMASYLKANHVNQVQLYFEDSSLFLKSLLACLLLQIPPVLLGNAKEANDDLFICDDNFHLFLLENISVKAEKLNPKALIYLLTSGSSGNSKKIPKTLEQIMHECLALQRHFCFKANSVVFSSVSHQHFYGLVFKIFLPLLGGFKIFSSQLKYPEEILANIIPEGIFISSPALLKRLSKYSLIDKLENLRAIISAGSALPEAIREIFALSAKQNITEIYGSTETGAMAYKNKDIFYPLENTFSLTKDGHAQISSLWCESFQTADEIEFCEDGFILLGRSDRIIKLEDKRVSLVAIEEFLLKSPLVEDCFINTHPEIGRLFCLVVLSQKGIDLFKSMGKKGINSALKEHLLQRYESVFLPRHFKILEKLPFNAQGKILKKDFVSSVLPRYKLEWKKIFSDKNSADFEALSSVDLYYFVEHFPAFPILPGFIQLSFVYEFAKCLDIENIKQIEMLKFPNFSHPNDKLHLNLKIKNSKLYFSLLSNDKISMQGRANFE